MKTYIITIAVLSAITLFSCKSGENLSKAEVISLVTEKVEASNYTFVPSTALPVSGRAVNLDRSFSLKISKDSIESYLPYFGRAYTAPISPTEGGIKFASTDFDYTISEKKKGMWNVSIETKDTRTRYKILLNIGETGYTSLTVQDTNRQSISFYGKIE